MKTTWKDYQKDIADDRYYYARSCIRQNFFPGSEAAFLNIIGNDLGRDIREDAQHTPVPVSATTATSYRWKRS